MALALSSEW